MGKLILLLTATLLATLISCNNSEEKAKMSRNLSASELLGDPNYRAISFGGFRENTRDSVPSISDLKEDLRILEAMNIKVLRTYNTQQYPHAENLIKAINELKQEDTNFEMYIMLGAWIDAKNAWTDEPVIHDVESLENNIAEIGAAARLANEYPDIVKIISVGNEAMVHWATSYFVTPDIILKWVNHLQDLKADGLLPADVWITSSDNFASWGGGDANYHNDDLNALYEAVDYVSIHTYPFHDTYHNSEFWLVPSQEQELSSIEQVDLAMLRAIEYSKSQYQAVMDYMHSIGVDKEIHIGETGWASFSNHLFDINGSKATDEYKQKAFHDQIRQWTDSEGISCFYFEAFNEQWKDQLNPQGSENHFGLINLNGEAKYALWHLVDNGTFEGLTRGGKPITKTFNGNEEAILENVLAPSYKEQQ